MQSQHKIIVCLLFILSADRCYAFAPDNHDSNTKKKEEQTTQTHYYGTSLWLSNSYSGSSTMLLFDLHSKGHLVSLGPKFTISRARIGEIEWPGFALNYTYFYNFASDFSGMSFVNFEFLKDETRVGSVNFNELHTGFGLRWKFQEHWQLLARTGIGGYAENYIINNTNSQLKGISYCAGFGISYRY